MESGRPPEACWIVPILFRIALALLAVGASADTPLERGLALLQDGRLDPAQAALREAVEQQPSSAAARNALGVALSRARRWPQAIAEFQQAVRLAPEHVEAHFNLGVACSAAGRHAEAAGAFRSVLALKLDFADARTGLVAALRAAAEETRKRGESQAAIRLYRELLALEPSPETFADLAAALLLSDELQAAQEALEKALRLQSDLARAHFLLARRFELAGDAEASLHEYRAAAHLGQQNVEFLLLYGAALSRSEPQQGVAILSEALEKASADPAADSSDYVAQAHFALGGLLARLGGREQAERHFEQARARRAQVAAREQALVHLNQGIARLNAGDARDAATAFQRTLALAPSLPEALHLLGVAQSALNNWPAADQSFRAALKARPGDAYILSSYATVLYAHERTEQAVSRLEAALEIDPNRPDARCLLAKALRRLGRLDASARELERARLAGVCSLEDEP